MRKLLFLILMFSSPQMARADDPVSAEIRQQQMRILQKMSQRMDHLETKVFGSPSYPTVAYQTYGQQQYQQPVYQPAYSQPVYHPAPVYQQPTYAAQQQRYVPQQYQYVSQSFYNPATGSSSGYAYVRPVIGY